MLKLRPVQQSMAGRITTKVTFPKHAKYVTDTGNFRKRPFDLCLQSLDKTTF